MEDHQFAQHFMTASALAGLLISSFLGVVFVTNGSLAAAAALGVTGVEQSAAVATTAALPDDYGNGTVNNGYYCPQLSTTIERGATDATTGGQVTELQKFLADYYNVNPNDLVTGYFGHLTQTYLIQFQQSQNLPAYGIAGQLTRPVIASVCAGNGSSANTSNPPTTSTVSPTYTPSYTPSYTPTNTSTNTNPTATINQSSLTTTSGTPTITGTATRVGSVYVYVTGNGQGGASQGVVSVTNGQWSTIIYPKGTFAFSAGNYTVSVYNGLGGPLLTTGTLTVAGSNTSSSLSATCYGSVYNATINGVSWEAQASGGSGSYTYQWSLPNISWINPSLGGLQTSAAMVNYSSAGVKQATVSISDGITSATASCSVEIVGSSATNAPQASTLTPTLSVDPNGGMAPLAVTFTTNLGNNYAIDFGDGSSAWVGNNPNGSVIGACPNASGCSYTTTYTYTAFGAYIAKLISSGVTYATQIVTVTQPISSLPSCPANATPQRGENGQTFTCTCPANFPLGSLWGVGSQGGTYYTDNSDICTAGIQAGQLNQASGGELMYTIDPGQNSYSAGTYNGITSQSYGAWPGSFQITGPKG